jgi:restriction endonuclease S subunit
MEFGNRLDAELYNPALRASFAQLQTSALELRPLRNVCTIRSGTTPSDRADGLLNGPTLFKTTDVRNQIITAGAQYYHISEAIYNRMRKTQLQDRDVLLNIVGATLRVIGRSALLIDFGEKANITQAMVFLRCRTADVLPAYLFLYLNTEFARDQIARYARPTGQYNLNLQEVGHIYVPIIPKAAQEHVESLIVAAAKLKRTAIEDYARAEAELRTRLDLDKLKLEKSMGYDALLSTVQGAHRLDAQHYDPRFKQLIDHLSQFPLTRIRDIRTFNKRGVQPFYVSNGPIDVVTSQHLGPMHVGYNALSKTSLATFNAASDAHIRNEDLLIYTTGAYVGRTNVYLSHSPALASNHVNILRLRRGVDSGYMGLVFQSIIGQLQTAKFSRGTAQAELYPSDIDRFIVPLLDVHIQKRLGNLVRSSLDMELRSRALVEDARIYVRECILGGGATINGRCLARHHDRA